MTQSRRKRILNACYTFLVPVAKFLLRSGISFREFEELGRLAFIDVASEDFGVRGRSTNISRISAMTGIPRKEVTRIKGSEEDYSDDPRIGLSLLGDVMHLWATNPDYCDLHGLPKPLPMDQGAISFESLVAQCSADVPCGAVRAELVRCHAIEVDKSGDLRLARRHIVSDNFDEKLVSGISISLRSLAETIAFNSEPTRIGPGRIERFVRSQPISLEACEELRTQIRTTIALHAEQFDDSFASQESPGDEPRRVIGVGMYYWEDENQC